MTNPNLNSRSTKMISKGIAYVNDLLSHSGDCLGYYDFMERYHIKINFVDLCSLTHSIPRHWLKNGKTKLNECNMKQSLQQTFCNKSIKASGYIKNSGL